MAWFRTSTKPLIEPMLDHIYLTIAYSVTGPQWVNRRCLFFEICGTFQLFMKHGIKPFGAETGIFRDKIGQYHDWALRCQVIGGHNFIDYVGKLDPCIPRRMVIYTRAIFVLRNDRKWKCMSAHRIQHDKLGLIFCVSQNPVLFLHPLVKLSQIICYDWSAYQTLRFLPKPRHARWSNTKRYIACTKEDLSWITENIRPSRSVIYLHFDRLTVIPCGQNIQHNGCSWRWAFLLGVFVGGFCEDFPSLVEVFLLQKYLDRHRGWNELWEAYNIQNLYCWWDRNDSTPEFHGTPKNWLSMAILSSDLLHGTVRAVTSSLGAGHSLFWKFQSSVECTKIGRAWPFS